MEEALVTLDADGTTSSDTDPVTATDPNEDGNTSLLAYTLGGAGEGSFDINLDTGQITVGEDAELDYETKKTHTVTVTATDPSQASATITVTIMVVGADEAPEIVGEDVEKDYTENGTGQVHRFTARDPEGRKVYWSLSSEPTNSPDTEDFSISDSGVLTFNTPPDFDAPADPDMGNTYVVSVVASDDAPGADGTTPGEASGMLSEKKVTVTVKDVDERGELTVSSRYPQASVSLTATLSDDDLDETERAAITWKWYTTRSGGTPISGATREMHTPTAAGSLRVTATYDDGNGEKTLAKVMTVRAAVDNADNADPVFPAGDIITREVVENSRAGTPVGLPVAATDPDSADSGKLTYTLTDDRGNFDIDWATGQLETTRPLDAEADDLSNGAYTVTVTVEDPSEETPVTKNVTITVKDVNEAPTVNLGATIISQDEDSATDFVLDMALSTYGATDPESGATDLEWDLTGADSGDFDISDDLELTFKEVPNYEMPADADGDNEYEVTVVVTDAGVDGKNKLTAERDMVIKVANVDEAGTVDLSSDHPKVDIELTATLTKDIDGGVTDETWQWYWGEITDVTSLPTTECDDDTSGSCLIVDATSNAYTPTAIGQGNGQTEAKLTAVVSYTDKEGPSKKALKASANAVIANTDNRPPEFEDADTGTTRYVIETAMEGAGVTLNADGTTATAAPDGDPVTATDPNGDGDTLTYTLGGTDKDSFDINSGTGQITVGEDAELDYETKETHTVTVAATDPSLASATITVTIMVVGVDEAPEIIVGGLAISGPSSANYAENGTEPVATYTLAGPKSDSGRWTLLSGDDGTDFSISNSGVLTFVRTPDFENPADADMDNVYRVTLTARDSEPNTATRDVVVTVTNVVGDEPVIGESLLDRYDANDDGMIEKEEARAAVTDYFNRIIDKEEAREVIKLYFASGSSS